MSRIIAFFVLVLLAPGLARADEITYSTSFYLADAYTGDLSGAFSEPLRKFELVELPRYSGAQPLTGVGISLSSVSRRSMYDLSALDDMENEELVNLVPPIFYFYGNDTFVNATIGGTLSVSLFDPGHVERTLSLPDLSAGCSDSTMDDVNVTVSCKTSATEQDAYNRELPVGSIPISDFIGSDPINFLLIIDGLLSGLCDGPDIGDWKGLDQCGVNAGWEWLGDIKVTYAYGTGPGETGGGGTDGAPTGELPEPQALALAGIALAGLRAAIRKVN